MKLSAECCNHEELNNQFSTVTDDPEFCMRTILLCIDTPYLDLPFDSILYHLGQLVYTYHLFHSSMHHYLLLEINTFQLTNNVVGILKY